MLKKTEQKCDVCSRLGKNQCGYHKFKKEYLSKLSGCRETGNQFSQTCSSINRISPSPHQVHPRSAFTPEKLSLRPVPINYNNQKVSDIKEAPRQNVKWESRVHPIPAQMQSRVIQTPIRPIAKENHILRVQGGQNVYYPIYPVYEVVYEPVTNQSRVMSPSRIIYN